MSPAKVLLLVLGVLILGALVIGGCAISGYNKVVRMDEDVDNKWAQVENQLQRRFDLIPNLVETVKGVAAQEEKIFVGVAEARSAYDRADSTSEKAQAATRFQSQLGIAINAVREAYPQLKSNESFLALQAQLEGTENRLSVERKRYNDAVRDLNAYIRGFPGRFYAGLAGVEKAEYFEVPEEAQAVPTVDFSGSGEGEST